MFFFCILFPQTNSLTFNLPDLSLQDQNVNITSSPRAYRSTRGLEVTPNTLDANLQQEAGKVTYKESLHLWDNSTRNLTDLYTHFVFVIDSHESPYFGDGLAFFLAPNGSNSTAGGAMGLPIDPVTIVHTSPFVAVEFDTYQNDGWDPVGLAHVGIDVNSLTSNVTAVWYCNITQGIENEAWISYDSSSHNLSVVFTGSINDSRVEDTMHLIVDLRDYLPDWVLSFNRSKKISLGAVVGLVVGSSFLVGGFVLVGFGLWRRSRSKEEDEFDVQMSMENEFESSSGPKKFSYGQLSQVTNNFEEEQKLGEGGFDGVYRGFLSESNSYIAVKRISKGSKQGIKEYATEVKIISQLRHRNLVQLIGWCHEKKELLLVYEFMENASLDFHLFEGKTMLTWATRYKIAQGLASALLYLHEE
ncbi:hypothetical protein C3L33_21092, partial [Rhododendron williamsianum]